MLADSVDLGQFIEPLAVQVSLSVKAIQLGWECCEIKEKTEIMFLAQSLTPNENKYQLRL